MARGGTKHRSAPSSASADKHPRKLRRQSTVETAAKSIKDNMKNMSEEVTYCKMVDGVTMLEQLCMDIRRRRYESGFTLGARYYRELRARYRSDLDPTSLLKGPSPPLKVDGALMRAMMATKRTRPDHFVMKGYLDKALEPLNHTELIGCLKWGLTLRVSCEKQIGPALSLLRYAARTKLQDSHPEEFDIMSEFWDSALLAAYARSRAQKVFGLNCPFWGPFWASGA